MVRTWGKEMRRDRKPYLPLPPRPTFAFRDIFPRPLPSNHPLSRYQPSCLPVFSSLSSLSATGFVSEKVNEFQRIERKFFSSPFSLRSAF